MGHSSGRWYLTYLPANKKDSSGRIIFWKRIHAANGLVPSYSLLFARWRFLRLILAVFGNVNLWVLSNHIFRNKSQLSSCVSNPCITLTISSMSSFPENYTAAKFYIVYKPAKFYGFFTLACCYPCTLLFIYGLSVSFYYYYSYMYGLDVFFFPYQRDCKKKKPS